MTQRFGLSDNTIKLLKSVFEKYSTIEKVIVYGSRAKGNFREGSDIDLTVIAPTLTLSDLLRMETEIENLMLPYKVDLSLFHLIDNSEVRDHIRRIGVTL